MTRMLSRSIVVLALLSSFGLAQADDPRRPTAVGSGPTVAPPKPVTITIESNYPKTIELKVHDHISFTCKTKTSRALFDPFPRVATVHPLDKLPRSVLKASNEGLTVRELSKSPSGEFTYEFWHYEAMRAGVCEIHFQEEGETKVDDVIKVIVTAKETLAIDWGKAMTDADIRKALSDYNVKSILAVDPSINTGHAYFVEIELSTGVRQVIREIRKLPNVKLATEWMEYPTLWPSN